MTPRERRSLRALRRTLAGSASPCAGPDRMLRVRRALRRWGATPAGACHAAALCNPDRVAIADEYTILTFAQLDRRTDSLASALRDCGYGPGDTLASMCSNHHWLVEAHIAASKRGMHILHLDLQGDPDRVAETLDRHRPQVFIHDEEGTGALLNAPGGCLRLHAAGMGGAALETVDHLIAQTPRRHEAPPDFRHSTVTLAASGAKGTWRERSWPATLLMPGTMSCTIPLRPRQSTMICAPLSGPWGHLHLTLALRLSSTLILGGRFDPIEALAALERHDADAVVLDDEMLQAIMALPRETLAWYGTSALRVIAVREPYLPGETAIPAINRFQAALYSRTGPSVVRLGATAASAEVPAAA
jgi:acyl-CoA synthetase (AMP-forming)/AMP-acid ligase II